MARKIIDTSDINVGKLKVSVFICNMIIVVLCIAGIVAMLLGHFLGINLKLKITEDNVQEVTKNMPEEYKIDPSILKDDPIEISLHTKIGGMTVISCIWSDSTTMLNTIVDEQIDVIARQIQPLFKQVAKAAIQVAVPKLEKSLFEELKKANPELADKTEEELKQEIKTNYGVDTDKVKVAMESAVDELLSEDAKPETAKKIITDEIDNQTKQLVSEGKISQEEVNKIKTDFSTSFDEQIAKYTDKDGNFDAYALMNKLMKDSGAISSTTETPSTASNKNTYEVMASSTTEESESFKEFKQNISDLIKPQLEASIDTLNIVLKIFGGLWAFSILMFAILLLATILKTFFAKNKTVSVFFACLFNFPGYVLIFILNIALANLETVLGWFNAGPVPPELNALVISLTSINWVSTLCAAIMMGGWFYYRLLKRKMKALVRENLIDRSVFVKDDYNPFDATPNYVGSSVQETRNSASYGDENFTKKNGISYYNLYGTKDYDDLDFEETKTQAPLD